MTVLSMLHDLDIQDKHRDILTVSADVQGISLQGSFELEDHQAEAAPRVEMRSDAKFEDGAVLGTIHVGTTLRPVGQMILRPEMKVQLTYQEATHDVMPLLQYLLAETRRCLSILLFGLASPEEADGPEWSPLDVGPSPDWSGE